MSPEELLSHYDLATDWPEPTGLEMPAAYERALAVRALRIARGEQPRGYKVGFTNRNIWPRYGVFAPIWGTVWDTTLSFCEAHADIPLDGISHPRLEPEAVFGIRHTPPEKAALEDLFDCIEWVAPGFEVVQSHQAWNFVAADTVADGGLHARLIVGQRVAAHEIATDSSSLEYLLSTAKVRLMCGEQEVEQGVGSNVLDGPVHALRYFLGALRGCPGAQDLQPGDVVTTGTWTDAWPIQPGETWRADFGKPLSSISVRFR